ncbi:hypothetical protein OOK31_04050 [Streptomyces sp. NBC_00249]|uniref:hypothetical protein n=1 Tax=Streptomyces sp. NBC_00249 TaxID=2975690 RepID=UPI002257DDBF|nr:hypothetical protein [Streptomyces sp. NBC_00249]MCX5193071.1 hypothetical protein [Streptomyces sp. NBC_00249]
MDAMNTGGGAGWAASGAVGPNASYRNQTLKYENVEMNFDESVGLRAVVQLWFQATAVSFLVFLIFGLLPALFSDSSSFESDNGLGFAWILSIIAFWVVLLASRTNEPVSEWKTLLEDKYAASSSAYAAIYSALARRQIPVSAVPVRIRSDITPEVVNNRLVIRTGRYVAYVTVFGYGTSLYVGWTMWRSRSGAVIIGQFLKDLVGGMLNRTGNINQMLRTETARAMREAVHSAAREGVEAAVQGIEVPMATAFGQEPPIQSAASAPAPGPRPAPVPGQGFGAAPAPGPGPAAPPMPPAPAAPAQPYAPSDPRTGSMPAAAPQPYSPQAPYSAPQAPPSPPAPPYTGHQQPTGDGN